MHVIWIILIHFLIYSLPVFLSAILEEESQIHLNYMLIGVIFTLTQLFDNLYLIKINEQFSLYGGDITYSALIFTTMFLIISQPEPKVFRNLIYFIFTMNLFLALLFILLINLFQSMDYLEMETVSFLLMEFSFRSLFFSFLLYSSEIFLQLLMLRFVVPKFNNQIITSLIICLSFFSVLVLDGVLYPLGMRGLFPGIEISIMYGIMAKLIFGIGFGLILFIYLNFFPSKISNFIASEFSFIRYFLPPKRRTLMEKYEQAQKEISKLQQILPMCSRCKRIRTDDGSWETVEEYIAEIDEVKFSHSYCPECMQKEMKLLDKK